MISVMIALKIHIMTCLGSKPVDRVEALHMLLLAVLCICEGANRAFQTSNGACVCWSGYIYYNQIDDKETSGNDASDCQPQVDMRCDITQLRLASSRQCVDPNSYDCTPACGVDGGTLNINLARCQCTSYVTPQELCDTVCEATSPTIGGTLNAAAQLQIVTTDPLTGDSTTETVPNTVGPSQHTSGTKLTIIVSFTTTEIQGHIITDKEQMDILQTPITASPSYVPASARRKLLQSASPVTNVPYIPNPVICLEIEDMIVFRIYIDETDRSLSNYPVYVKDHLYNSNPTFDYGAFTELKFLVEETNLTIWTFAHVFTEAGEFVFADAQEPDREMIISVKPDGAICDDSQNRIQPSSPSNLVYYGVTRNNVLNEEPDWGLVIGMLAFLAACIVMVIVAVIVWRPRNAGIYPMKMWKPKYRNVGAPPQIPPYLQYCDYDREEIVFGPRGIPDGIEGGLAYKSTENGELEDFNARTFYDKLEDQTLYLNAQLAKHREELKNFYDRISRQNDELKNMLNNLDLSKLEEIEKNRRRQALRDGAAESGMTGAGATVVNTTIRGGDVTRQYNLGGSSRDQELMQALQLLLERINSGSIPLSIDILRQAGLGGNLGTYNIYGKTVSGRGSSADLVKRQGAERMQLEKELHDDEDKEMDKLSEEHENKRQEVLQKMSSKLASQLDGDLSQSEVDRIMSDHEKELAALLARLDGQKQRQTQDLRDRLAQRRKQKEKTLREKHVKEAEEAGIPPPEEKKGDCDNQLKLHQSVIDTLHAEESTALAKALTKQTTESTQEQQQKLSENLANAIESLENTGVITIDEKEEMIAAQRQSERVALDKMDKRQAVQVNALKDRMAKKKRKQIRDLKSKQDAELEK
ncbi:uncharacterized protein LOC100375297, partial [Saccoglossus kowalevskii]